jgi:cellobiose-specific phosphotransferase system component IIC
MVALAGLTPIRYAPVLMAGYPLLLLCALVFTEQAAEREVRAVAAWAAVLAVAYFVAALLALLLTMAVAAIRARSREVPGPAIGAVGALASMLVSFYTGLYIEGLIALSGWIVVGLGMSGLVTRPPRRA